MRFINFSVFNVNFSIWIHSPEIWSVVEEGIRIVVQVENDAINLFLIRFRQLYCNYSIFHVLILRTNDHKMSIFIEIIWNIYFYIFSIYWIFNSINYFQFYFFCLNQQVHVPYIEAYRNLLGSRYSLPRAIKFNCQNFLDVIHYNIIQLHFNPMPILRCLLLDLIDSTITIHGRDLFYTFCLFCVFGNEKKASSQIKYYVSSLQQQKK